MVRLLMIFICIMFLSSCSSVSCDESIEMSILPIEGRLKIDSIYVDPGMHLDVFYNRSGKKIGAAGDFVIDPKIGDSLIKYKNHPEYILYTKDSIYVQKWDCDRNTAVILEQRRRE